MFVRTSRSKLSHFYSLTVSHCPQHRAFSRVVTTISPRGLPSYPNRAIHSTNHILAPTRRPVSNMSSQSALAGKPAGFQTPELWRIASTKTGEPTIHAVFEKGTSTWQYIVADPASSRAVIIDPVLDYDRATQTISTESADSLLSMVKEQGYNIDMILETHVHADHLTAASYLQSKLAQDGIQPVIGIGKRIEKVQNLFGQRYGIPESEYKGVFGKYFDDDEVFSIGGLSATVFHLPGHTPDHLGYKIGDNVFCGDSVFHADIGTARCDFPGGSARDLYQSGKKLLSLSDEVKIWTGHDYPPQGREGPRPWMSVREHRQSNKHLMDGTTLDTYVTLREERDAQMSEPKLIHPALQVNIRAGRLPESTPEGLRLLRLPMLGAW